MTYPRAKLATTVASILAVTALLGTIGADSRWLAALGHTIVSSGRIPNGVPFAAAPSGHWANAVVLAELIFHALESAFGDRGLLLAQLVAVGVAFTAIAKDALAGDAEAAGVSRTLIAVAVGGASALIIVRVQMFSLALFPIVCALLRADARRPSARIWLLVPVLALWSNLHGGVLLGCGVTFAYLALVRLRRRPLETVALALSCAVALCLTPALLATPGYYHGLLTNAAAQRGEGMWGPPSLTSPLDLALIASALLLAVWTRRARPERWEIAVSVGLALLTVQAARNGVWLLVFLAPIAARARARQREHPRWRVGTQIAALAAAGVFAVGLARGPLEHGASPALIDRAIALAHGSPVLAIDGIDEQVAQAGGRIWAGDPIDAFTQADQNAYLNFVQGASSGRRTLTSAIEVVLVPRNSGAQRLMARTDSFTLSGNDAATDLYVRRPRAYAATARPPARRSAPDTE
jgi:hypothetical protein